jgi:uncharacterized protein (DUF1501 family)
MQTTRREFLRLGLGTSALVSCSPTVPLFLARTAGAAAPPAAGGNVLVVVELSGGNDGLNTVVPFKDDDYRKHRRLLQIAAGNVRKVDGRVGFHPALAGFEKLLQDGRLALVQSVGYPNPNRSHFESMAIWHTGKLKPAAQSGGWLARALDAGKAPGGDASALHVGATVLPQALTGGGRQVPSLTDLEQFRRRLGVPEAAGARGQRAALDRLLAEQRGKAGSLLEFVEQSSTLTYASSARLEGVAKAAKGAPGPANVFSLGRRLNLIAQLIKAGLSTSIYYTELGGFDTHSHQLATHDQLLRELGGSLLTFCDDLKKAGLGRRVLVLVFSEFGRRLRENASAGTDHGTAAPVFLLGGAVKAGVHGPYPDLQDLADGDPKFALDFRRVYATLLEGWLGCPAEKVLGAKFPPLALLVKA